MKSFGKCNENQHLLKHAFIISRVNLTEHFTDYHFVLWAAMLHTLATKLEFM